MFVTKELRQAVGNMLLYMEGPIQLLEELAARNDDWAHDKFLQFAGERALHVTMETMTDVGNLMIDTLVMRDPGSYPDIIRVLAEERVVSPDWFRRFEGCLEFRDRLVHKYKDLTSDDVLQAVKMYAGLFRPYLTDIRNYLEIEA